MSAGQSGPRVGCGAAILRGGRLLLTRRRRDPEAGCWGLIGGKVDAFETVAEATAREVHEELGITIAPADLLCVAELIDRPTGQHWIAPVFRIDTYGGTPAIMEPEAASDLGWFALDALPAPLTQATRQAVAAIVRTRG